MYILGILKSYGTYSDGFVAIIIAGYLVIIRLIIHL